MQHASERTTTICFHDGGEILRASIVPTIFGLDLHRTTCLDQKLSPKILDLLKDNDLLY